MTSHGIYRWNEHVTEVMRTADVDYIDVCLHLQRTMAPLRRLERTGSCDLFITTLMVCLLVPTVFVIVQDVLCLSPSCRRNQLPTAFSTSTLVSVAESTHRKTNRASWQPKSKAFRCKHKTLKDEWFKSQLSEDKKLLTWFQGICGGSYMEIGGLDGVRFSNTYVFNKGLNWTGVLAEASPKNFAQLVVNRPRDLAINAGVCEEKRKLHWVEGRVNPVGGFEEFATDAFKKMWWTEAGRKNAMEVECMPLRELLRNTVGEKHVFDFFSLDIEGGEFSALKSLDFEEVAFGVLLVEADEHNELKNTAVRGLIESNGYTFLEQREKSYWFINRDFSGMYGHILYDL